MVPGIFVLISTLPLLVSILPINVPTLTVSPGVNRVDSFPSTGRGLHPGFNMETIMSCQRRHRSGRVTAQRCAGPWDRYPKSF